MSREALFGAAVTLLSLAIGALLTYWTGTVQYRRQLIAEKTRKRAEKFEELIAALYEHKKWIGIVDNIYLFGREVEEPLSPLPRVEAIVAVYFPSFREQINEIDKRADAYYGWLLDRGQLRLAGNPVGVVCDGRNDVFGPYYKAFLDLIRDLHDFAEREFR